MKKNIKLTITAIKASPQFKSSIIIQIILFISYILLLLSGSDIVYTNSILVALPPVTFFQLIMATNGSGIVRSSAYAKKLQTGYPIFLLFLVNVIIFSLFSLLISCASNTLSDSLSAQDIQTLQSSSVIFISILMVVNEISEIIMYKFYVVGIICLTLFVLIPYLYIYITKPSVINIPMPNAFLTGLLIITAGSLLSYLTANLLYKYPICGFVIKNTNKT